jgi:putative radical SAM enzyme (TIGR03279 family)
VRLLVKIIDVEKASIAKKHGIKPGDTLKSINGNEIRDVLDYRFYLTEKKISVELISLSGEEYVVKITKGEYDDIGLVFETPLMDKKHTCKNGCIFCFIDQNPEGLRDSLYFKDDDSRLSFIHGNYITLTNMNDVDVERIVKMRFSPINISVHTTNPELRVKMMKNKRSGEVLKYLKTFADAGLSMCGQIVLCRGINDGEELLRTMNDLAEYFPNMGSVSVVPAGLTKFRDKLYPLTDFTEAEAREVIDMIDSVGADMKKRHGSRMFFAADELYLKAKRPIPDEDYYEGYPQIENGVGMLRSFAEEFSMAWEDIADMKDSITEKREVSVVTGKASYPMIKSLCDRLMSFAPALTVNVYEIKNYFYGESITVSGLLTGKDISEQLMGKRLGEELFIPENCLRSGEDVFLCGMTLAELSRNLSVKISVSENDGYEFVRSILGLE